LVLSEDRHFSTTVESTPVTPVTPPPVVDQPASAIRLKLINNNGTYYLIQNGIRHGITNPGILFSYGFALFQAKPATLEEMQLPEGDLLLPGDGVLAKTATDKTVYLISGNRRFGFTSEAIFTSLGFKFSQVLTVTAPELLKQSEADPINDPNIAHLPGTDIQDGSTVYWVGYDGKRYPYPSLEVYNSWHIPGDFSRVLPANAADLALPIAEAVTARVAE
jgi:hypothetical protein